VSQKSRRKRLHAEHASGNPVAIRIFRTRRPFEAVLGSSGELGKLPGLAEMQARVLVERAEEAEDAEEAKKLAKEAVNIDPDCAQAYAILADNAESPADALPLCEKALAAGERQLQRAGLRPEGEGSLSNEEAAGGYLEARALLGVCLKALGRVEESLLHFAHLIRLDFTDRVGARHHMAEAALYSRKIDVLDELLKFYDWDRSGNWLYVQALTEFLRGGDCWKARKALNRARARNPLIAEILVAPDQNPPKDWEEDPYLLQRLEAVFHARWYAPIWEEVEGAVEWLRKH